MLIVNIKQLVGIRDTSQLLRGKEMASLPCLDQAYVRIEGGEIADYGSMNDLNPSHISHPDTVDATGQYVLPAWCDSHTHLVYAGSREQEFVDKIQGLSYEAIAQKGGGILNSARRVNETSEEELFRLAWKRLEEVKKLGT